MGTSVGSTKWLDDIYMKEDDYKIYGRTTVQCKIFKFEIIE